jgi:transposase
MNDGTGLAEALLGLDGFRALEVTETPDEVVITVETMADFVGCGSCGTRAVAHEGKLVAVRDLPCFGRPARPVWVKRRWRCVEPGCEAKTWTEGSEHVDAKVVLTRRAGAEACRQVGELARPVSIVATEFGVCWWTVMNAVAEHGTPLVDDPPPHRRGGPARDRRDLVPGRQPSPRHRVRHRPGRSRGQGGIDMVKGNGAADLRGWTAKADPTWLGGIEVVATDLAESFRAGLSPDLDHARRVADPFHVVRAGNRCLDKVRRRVQNETLGHRGRKRDPLYRIRKLLLSGHERLDEAGRQRMLLGLRVGDPGRRGARGVAGQGVSQRRVPRRGPHRGGAVVGQGHRRLR